MSSHFDHVSVEKRANVYQDSRCISFNLTFPDRSRKTVGVILPGTVTFAADTAQTMEIIAGKCRVRLHEAPWHDYEQGQRFHVAAQTRFDVETDSPLHYVCHFSHQADNIARTG